MFLQRVKKKYQPKMVTSSTARVYKGFDIDLAEDDDYENYIIYDQKIGKYLGEILNQGQPIAHDINEAKK
jgi:hypothetical protein